MGLWGRLTGEFDNKKKVRLCELKFPGTEGYTCSRCKNPMNDTFLQMVDVGDDDRNETTNLALHRIYVGEQLGKGPSKLTLNEFLKYSNLRCCYHCGNDFSKNQPSDFLEYLSKFSFL